MKKLFTFELEKDEIIEVTETQTNDKNEQVTITKKETKKVPHKFIIRKPTRSMIDEGKLFYGSKFADALKAGLMPVALLNKRFSNDKGVLSDPEKEHYSTLYVNLAAKRNELEKQAKKPEDMTPEEKDVNQKLLKEITILYRQIQEMESNQSDLFSNTAEAFSRDRTATWWIIQLAYKVKEDKEVPVFGEETDKLDTRHDKLEESVESEDGFTKRMANAFIFLINFWFTGKIADEGDFESAWKLIRSEI